MSLPRKNLLEAFRKSDAPGAAAGVPAPSAGSAVPQAAPHAAPLQGRGALGRARSGKDVVWAVGVVAVVLSFALGFLLGRNTQDEARAEEPAPLEAALRSHPSNQPRAFQEPPFANPGATPVAGESAPKNASPANGAQRIEDSALFDPANLWTVIVASYTKSNEDLAWATHEHLRDARLPVFPPVASRNLVVVLAGAAPTSAELDRVAAAVKALARDGKKNDYADAYCARIDTLIPRPKQGTSKP